MKQMFDVLTVYTMSQMLWSVMLKQEGVVQVRKNTRTQPVHAIAITGDVQPGDDLSSLTYITLLC